MSNRVIGTLKISINGNGANMGILARSFGMKGLSGHIKQFCDDFNAATKGREKELLRVIITIYDNKTISFVIKNESTVNSLLKALNINKGSGTPNVLKKGVLPLSKAIEIAKYKLEDLNAYDVDKALKTIKGTAKSIGVDIE